MFKKILTVTSGACLTAFSMSAMAGNLYMNVEEQAKQAKEQNVALEQDVIIDRKGKSLEAKVLQLGLPEQVTVLKGFGEQVTLQSALEQIVPTEWVVKKKYNINLDKVVSWKGDTNWVVVLNELANNVGFNAVVDWNTKNVLLVGAKPKKVAPPPKVVEEPKPTINDLTAWTLDPSRSLRENVTAWAETIGWTVSWDAVDYPIVAETTLYGKFDDVNGPLKQLAMSYLNADQPLAISIKSGNKVVRVENLMFNKPLHSPTYGTDFKSSYKLKDKE